MAGAPTGGHGPVTSLPPPLPKSPPQYPDLQGNCRAMNKVQRLERQIGCLQEELESMEGLHPASRCCKEVAEFVASNADPLMPNKHRKNRTSCGFWNWLCPLPCLRMSCLCCCSHSECTCHLKCSSCCGCNRDPCGCGSCVKCSLPSLKCFSSPKCDRCSTISCSRNCCVFQFPSCRGCCCGGCKCSCFRPKCPKVRCRCCDCRSLCCSPCCVL